jgi:hypothetical protein
MMKNYYIYLLFIFYLILSLAGCSRKIYQVAYPTLNDGKYDTEFPYKSCSSELESISKTVRKLSAIAYYKSYVFSREEAMTVHDVRKGGYKKQAEKEIYYNNSVIGSATVLLYQGRRIMLLSCAHVVDFEDTVYTYYSDENKKLTPYLQSMALKQRQNNFVADLPEKGELEILAMDRTKDIALLGKVFTGDTRFPIPVFGYRFGNAKNLEWGSFVYLLGYPKGYLMVTRGIVSQPNRDHNGSFLVDALFNKGFSGGIVLAIRDGVPNFELVGLASSVAADFEYLMVPPSDISRIGYDPRIPYTDEIFVNLEKRVNYGITFIVSAEMIQSFIKENKIKLLEAGWDLSPLIS